MRTENKFLGFRFVVNEIRPDPVTVYCHTNERQIDNVHSVQLLHRIDRVRTNTDDDMVYISVEVDVALYIADCVCI